MSSHVLADRDVNTAAPQPSTDVKADVKSMDYHRQVLQSRLEEGTCAYVSPSDNIMSPCTAKLNAFRTKRIMKTKPKLLFAPPAAGNKLPAVENQPEAEKTVDK